MPQLQLLADLPGHADPAWSVAFNPIRPLLASCSTDRTVRLYHYVLPQGSQAQPAQEGQSSAQNELSSYYPSSDSPKPRIEYLTTIPTQHKKSIRSVAWAPSGRTLATGSFDSTVGVWEEVDPDREDGEDQVGEDGAEGVFRPSRLAGGGDGNRDEAGDDEDVDVQDQDQETSGGKEWECVTTLEGHESECKSVGFSSDGALLGSCSRDRSVWVWEVQPDSDFECIAVMMEHTQDVKCIAWHPHEEILASASYDSHIHLLYDDPDSDWCPFQKLHPKLPAIPLVQLIHDHSQSVDNAKLSLQSSATTDSGSGSATAANSESALHPPPAARSEAISQTTLSALLPTEAERLAEQEVDVPPLQEDETVWCLAWSPCGGWLASGGDEGGVRIWKRGGNRTDSPLTELIHFSAHTGACFTLSWSSGGLPTSQGGLGLLASGGADGRIIIWQLVDTKHQSTIDPEAPPAKSPLSSINGKDTGVQVYPVAAVRNAHGVADVNAVNWCLREDGKGQGMLASAGDDGTVKVWRVVA